MTQQDVQVLCDQYNNLIDATQRYADSLRRCQAQLAIAGAILGETGQHCGCSDNYICDTCLETMLAEMEMEYDAQGGKY